jgi:hypothetical protein
MGQMAPICRFTAAPGWYPGRLVMACLAAADLQAWAVKLYT